MSFADAWNSLDSPSATGTRPEAFRSCFAARTASGLSAVIHARQGSKKAKGTKGAQDAERGAYAWLQRELTFQPGPHEKEASFLYTLFCIERIGMLTGRRWFGEHDWYEQSARAVLRQQEQPGIWRGYAENIEIALALLLLKRSQRVVTTTGDAK